MNAAWIALQVIGEVWLACVVILVTAYAACVLWDHLFPVEREIPSAELANRIVRGERADNRSRDRRPAA